MILGVDVSDYQPVVDWELLKAAGVEFVLVRNVLPLRAVNDGMNSCLPDTVTCLVETDQGHRYVDVAVLYVK